jgi:hypothetical protein
MPRLSAFALLARSIVTRLRSSGVVAGFLVYAVPVAFQRFSCGVCASSSAVSSK